MLAFLMRRVALLALVLLGVLTIICILFMFLPGDVARYYAGPHATAQVLQEIRHELGLDQPKLVQYGKYMWLALHGDLGYSAMLDEPVTTAILQRLPTTALLAVSILATEMILAVVLGALAALNPRGPMDRLLAWLAALGTSLPSFWVGIVLLYVVAFKWGVLPLGGYGDPVILYLILPTATLGVPGGFWYARILRASLVGELHEDYVRTARSKGLARRNVVLRHALPNAIVPVLTVAALDLGTLLGGVVILEQVFSWPGIGLQAYQALGAMDVPLVIGTAIFTALFIAVLNIVADLLRAVLDPRVRLD
jgi:peptide/nickel transport system permease protein